MKRRDFLKVSALLIAGCQARATTSTAELRQQPDRAFDHYFEPILNGFLRNAKATSPDYTVCDYPEGTKLKSCCTPGGKTYVSVARMLPPMVEWRTARGASELNAVLLSIYRNAFDPGNPDFWGYAPSTRPTQLSVEAALVAYALARLGEDFVSQLTSTQRTNLQNWLASCTQCPERKTNHAWFTAINHATRLRLAASFREFHGDEQWMLDDLTALDAMQSSDGWYSDSPDQPIYDLYNFYAFANFPLMWGQIVDGRYSQWNERFRGRVRTFLATAPNFFAANGAHPLMGRSLVYRFAVLSPLVLGYQQGLWPHSPGLLRRIVRMNLECHWNLGCFDAARGKLRETYSADATPAAREPYIDNGHPYWAMLGFAFLSIPKTDRFWTDREAPLPVERGDYLIPFHGPKFLLQGCRRTGQVRWLQAQNSPKRDTYRDKYSKFVWSSHFAFCAAGEKSPPTPDQALLFRDIATGVCATRAANGVIMASLIDAGVETTWFAQLGEWKFTVISRIRLTESGEVREHQITAPPEAVGKVEILEGSFATPGSIDAIELRINRGYDRIEVHQLEGVNLIHRTVKCRVAVGRISAVDSECSITHSAQP